MAFVEGNGGIKNIYIECLIKSAHEANMCDAKVF